MNQMVTRVLQPKKNCSQRVSLKEVQRKFETWRGQRSKGRGVIPNVLWQDAVSLAKSHSASFICKALRVEYGKLKRLIQESQEPVASEEFVETVIPKDVSWSRIALLAEIATPSGAVLRLYSTETVAIIKAFLTV